VQVSLRGAILDKFPSATAFGKAMGWPRKKASDVMNGRRKLDAEDMQAVAKAIEVQDSESFLALFFPSLSTK